MNLPYPQVWFTYGPQTTDDEVLASLLQAGATGARLTFSYGTPAIQAERAAQLRRIAEQMRTSIFVVADLQGEKTRFAKIADLTEIRVSAKEPIVIGDVTPSTKQPLRIPVQFPELLRSIRPGDLLVEGDGALLLTVIATDPTRVTVVPDIDGIIHPGRGFVVQSTHYQPRPLTDKDLKDLDAISTSPLFDAVAVSFVGSATDIEETRERCSLPIVAKIETPRGIANLEEICAAADVVMAARGDLALTIPWVELPDAVDDLARAAAATKTPWILATQLAEGLERFSFPTRAEICDLAHWMRAGAHGAMLSYETAFGSRPRAAVDAVHRIVTRYARIH